MRAMHDLTVGNDWVSAADFWRMAPGAVWWLIDAKMPPEAKSRDSDMGEVVKMVKAAKKKEAANG